MDVIGKRFQIHFSIVLAAYNAELYIRATIESVLNQTFKDFEFIIVNDASTDNTLAIIQEYLKKDSRIKIIDNKENQFVIASRNKAIKSSVGKYIAIIDADDIWVPNKLEKQINDLENNPEIFLLSSNAYSINEKGEKTGEIIRPHLQEETRRMMKLNNPFCHPSIVFKNEGYYYREKMYYTEEYDLYLRMFSDGKLLVHRKDFLFYYRILKNSLSRSNNSLIQALFKAKAIEFYHQRKIKNFDNYEEFNPQDYLQIFNEGYPSNLKDLRIAMKLSFIAGQKENFYKIYKKAKNQYKIRQFFLFWIISINFSFFQSLYRLK